MSWFHFVKDTGPYSSAALFPDVNDSKQRVYKVNQTDVDGCLPEDQEDQADQRHLSSLSLPETQKEIFISHLISLKKKSIFFFFFFKVSISVDYFKFLLGVVYSQAVLLFPVHLVAHPCQEYPVAEPAKTVMCSQKWYQTSDS